MTQKYFGFITQNDGFVDAEQGLDDIFLLFVLILLPILAVLLYLFLRKFYKHASVKKHNKQKRTKHYL
jgi:RsiW-degrading membrane proteinase PrsW (M82 family)